MACVGADLLFHASFDKGLEAEWAYGSRMPSYVKTQENALAPGKFGNCVRIGPWKGVLLDDSKEGKDLEYSYSYQAERNLDEKCGAVSFWVNPVDWDGSDAFPHRLFVQFQADSASLTIYKFLNVSNLYCHIVSQGKEVGSPMGAIANWKKGEWHHVAICWKEGVVTGFVDGVSTGKFDYPAFKEPFKNIVLGKLDWGFENGASLLDDFRIYDAPLSETEIIDIIDGAGTEQRAFLMNLGKTKKTPIIDGAIEKDEYALASTGFQQHGKQILNPADKQAEYFLSQDGERLYIGIRSPAPENPKTQEFYGRDGNVWEDETVEIHFDVPGKNRYQFIVNTADGIFDSRNGNPVWDSAGMAYKNTVHDGIWTFEFSVPLAEVDLTEGPFGMNLCRSYQTPMMLSCIVPLKANASYADGTRFCTVRLLDDECTPVELVSLDGFDRKNSMVAARGADGGRLVVGYGGKKKDEGAINDTPLRFAKEDLTAGSAVGVHLFDGLDHEVYSNFFTVNRLEPLTLEYIYTDMPTETIRFAVKSLLEPEKRGVLHLEVTKRFGGERVDVVDLPLGIYQDEAFEVPYNAAHLAKGHYVLKGRYVSPSGGSVEVFTEEWLKPEKQVLVDYTDDSRIKVQPPWKPLEQNGNALKTPYQEISFDGPYIGQITALSQTLLADASFLEINGSRDGRIVKTHLDNHGDYCRITQEIEYGAVTVTLSSRMEFDGLVKTKMTIAPHDGTAQVSSVKLCFPLDSKHTKYVNAFNGFGNGDGKSGVLSAEKAWHTDLFKQFSFWIGDEKVGFSWVCRNTAGWHCRQNGRSLELQPVENGRRLAVLNIVDTAFELNVPRTIEFAIMASPSRTPDAELLRTQNRAWRMWSGYYSKFYEYHEPGFLEERVGNANYFHYVSVGISPHGPAFHYYQQDWNCGKLGEVEEDIIPNTLDERNRVHWLHSCLNSQSFLNYKLDHVKFLINYEPLNLQNLYIDLMCGRKDCVSKGHGCGWTDDFGREWASYDWEGRRVFLRELRAELKKKNPRGYISLHTHYQRLPMILSFGDIQVGGEDFVNEVGREGNYYDVVNSDILRAYSVAYGGGVKCVFIPQFDRSLMFVKPGTQYDPTLPENIWAMRHLSVMLFVHDIDVWLEPWSPLEECKRIWDFETEFGWGKEVVFEPYRDNHGLYEVIKDSTGGKVIPGLFRRDGRFLLGVLNDSANECQTALKLDFPALLQKEAPAFIRDMYDPERKHTVQDGILTLNLLPREGTIIWFE